MRFITAIFCILGFAANSSAENIRIENVTVISMDQSTVQEGVVVTIVGERIRHIGTADKAPSLHGAPRIIDGTGKYLIPGLAEMHGHLPASGWDKDRTEDTLFLYLAGGVTTVRGMLGDPVQFDLRQKIELGEIAGPTLYLAAPSLNGRSVTSVEEAIQKTKQYAAAGWDLQKLHGGLSLEEYDAIAATANALGYPFGGHVSADVGIEHSLDAGQISIDHMDGYLQWLGGYERPLTAEDIQKAVDKTLASGAWVVPTQALFNTFYAGADEDPTLPEDEVSALLARPETAYVDKAMLARWEQTARSVRRSAMVVENRRKLLKAFADAGAHVAMGSDAPQTFSVPGFSVWREIEEMVAGGMSAEQILHIGTKAAGDYLKDKDTFGVIKAGARADLILLDADPRADIMNITKQAGVMAAGRWYSRDEIDARLKEIAARHGN
ncbi:amidohydrolase family protein [Kordiimonas lacus]|uniref:Imidazolonepropionase n=1 Tax=Kordiimonas lacus TaxID=637679 RepID=A0A1G6VG19_9PROT|nr:amidohydrolase family protein [Kordiimonas lacus]SDD52519.1 Imidazolonepropionase [Kordiimonas lacus]